MKLTKGKILKLYNKKRQTLKKMNKSKIYYKKKTLRNKKKLNLARKTLKNIYKGGQENNIDNPKDLTITQIENTETEINDPDKIDETINNIDETTNNIDEI